MVYLLDEFDASLQVHTEVNKYPLDTFALVLFLLKHEHVVVEELLQLLVGEVDAQLFKAVELHGRTQKEINTRIRHIVNRRSDSMNKGKGMFQLANGGVNIKITSVVSARFSPVVS